MSSRIVLPHELNLKIAESNLSAALGLALAEVITREDFRRVCNRATNLEFEEYWSFLRKISKLQNEYVWHKLAHEKGTSCMDHAWKLLDPNRCWNHQDWASSAKYQLALRGIVACPEDRDKLVVQGCVENPFTAHHSDLICEDYHCYKYNIAIQMFKSP
jgi:hypothetical protein